MTRDEWFSWMLDGTGGARYRDWVPSDPLDRAQRYVAEVRARHPEMQVRARYEQEPPTIPVSVRK